MKKKKLKIGDGVTIHTCPELVALKLNELDGRSGVVCGIAHKGYYIYFDTPYLNEVEWFIPEQAV